MKILQIAIENYKKISTLVLEPNGEDVKISGKTGQGKTTAISALWDIFQMVGTPIKNGEKKGKIRVTLGDNKPQIVVERRFTAKTKQLLISDPDGENKLSAPEFKEMLCDLAVNPHKIMELKPTEQLSTLLKTVTFPQGFNLAGVEDSIITLSQEASDYGRDAKRMESSLGDRPEEVEAVDIRELYAKKETITAQNTQVKNSNQDLVNTRAKLVGLREDLETYEKYEIELVAYLKTVTETDTSIIEKSIMENEATNTKATLFSAWEIKQKELDGVKQSQLNKESAVTKLKLEKKTALEKASWPLPGLKAEGGKVMYNGVPLSQCGNSEQMLICGALAATQIREKDLKIVRMDGIESMSPADFTALSTIFNRDGIQVLSSRVSRGDIEAGEIVIEDGKIVQKQG